MWLQNQAPVGECNSPLHLRLGLMDVEESTFFLGRADKGTQTHSEAAVRQAARRDGFRPKA